MKRIGSKLFAALLCMSLLIVGLLWLIQAVFMKDNYLNERVRSIGNAMQSAANTEPFDYQGLESSLNISLLHVDMDGSILYMSQGLPMRGMLTRQISTLMEQGKNGEPVYLQNTSQKMRYAVTGLALFGGGGLFAVFSLADVEEASRILLQQLWIITAVLLASSILLAVILSRMLALPVLKVTQAAREIAGGNLNISLPVRSKDEIGRLTEALNEMARELQKTEDLRHELIANVSHELRSPLAVIQGFAETVRDVTWPDEVKREQQLTIISDEASRLNKTVNDILDYSRLQAGVDKIAPADFAAGKVLQETVTRFELEAAKRNLKILLECPDLTVRFDQNRFIQIVNNLIGNALNHAQEGSDIDVSAAAYGKSARISVKNHGETIPGEELKYIWDRYYRSGQARDNKPLGTGLGLSIVKSILDLHGSVYGVTSENNCTEFWFETIPL